jgi:hypothetical protein
MENKQIMVSITSLIIDFTKHGNMWSTCHDKEGMVNVWFGANLQQNILDQCYLQAYEEFII